MEFRLLHQVHLLGQFEVDLLVDIDRFVPGYLEEQGSMADPVASLFQYRSCEQIEA